MSDDKNNKYDGETFQNVIKETMVANSIPNAISKMIEGFDETRRNQTLESVKSLSSVIDRLKFLIEQVGQESVDDKQD